MTAGGVPIMKGGRVISAQDEQTAKAGIAGM
jgi:hypothetical protein